MHQKNNPRTVTGARLLFDKALQDVKPSMRNAEPLRLKAIPTKGQQRQSAKVDLHR
jgi:hypothetical protein